MQPFFVRENDTTAYTLNLVYDEANRPSYFYRNIFTPVCYTGECKPVYINFYWDLLGNYIRYDLPTGKVLTKMDHKEFTEENYNKLQDILANPNSILGEVSIYDLITPDQDKLADSVDAKTGATLKTIRSEVIEGAVYTCYTLWHIAYGGGVKQMQHITDSLTTDDLMHRFLASQNHHYQYWAMDKVMNRKEFLPDLLLVIRGKNVFTARHALQQINPQVFTSRSSQQWLWATYQEANYALQTAILKKLEVISLQEGLTLNLAAALDKANREQFKKMIALLNKQPKLSAQTMEVLAAQLQTITPDYAAGIYKMLDAKKPKQAEVIAQMKAYRMKNHPN
ncbi:MAG: hypothetical protein QM669_13205 [Siphonobacter sp.]